MHPGYKTSMIFRRTNQMFVCFFQSEREELLFLLNFLGLIAKLYLPSDFAVKLFNPIHLVRPSPQSSHVSRRQRGYHLRRGNSQKTPRFTISLILLLTNFLSLRKRSTCISWICRHYSN